MSSYRPQNLYNLSGRIAVVTGGGTGIGLMIAHGLAGSGAKVYITGRRVEVLQKAASSWNDQKIGGTIIPLKMDVTDKDSILEGKKHIENKEGKLHILVNNAGQGSPASLFFNDLSAPEHKDVETLGMALFNESLDGWVDVFKINTFSIFFVTNAFLGLLDKGSRDVNGYTSVVINNTSISGVIKIAQDHFGYNNSKAAASHLTKMQATEFALKNVKVRVNAIAPGVYASEMTLDVVEGEDVEKIAKGVVPVPAARAGTAEEMAGTVVYLASRAGAYTNGQEIVIDGGYVAVNPSVV